jgi:hypothetical protein
MIVQLAARRGCSSPPRWSARIPPIPQARYQHSQHSTCFGTGSTVPIPNPPWSTAPRRSWRRVILTTLFARSITSSILVSQELYLHTSNYWMCLSPNPWKQVPIKSSLFSLSSRHPYPGRRFAGLTIAARCVLTLIGPILRAARIGKPTTFFLVRTDRDRWFNTVLNRAKWGLAGKRRCISPQ